jgi:glutathione S-transferase
MLNELEIPFEEVSVDLVKGENWKPEYLKKNPSGRVPYFESPELSFCESGAVLLYLADLYPEKGFAPEIGSPLRALYYQWFLYVSTTLEGPSFQLYLNGAFRPDAEGAVEALETANRHFDRVSRFLDFSLDGKKFLLGSQFSAADIMVGASLHWANYAKALDRHPTLKRYLLELMKRPAFAKSFGT